MSNKTLFEFDALAHFEVIEPRLLTIVGAGVHATDAFKSLPVQGDNGYCNNNALCDNTFCANTVCVPVNMVC